MYLSNSIFILPTRLFCETDWRLLSRLPPSPIRIPVKRTRVEHCVCVWGRSDYYIAAPKLFYSFKEKIKKRGKRENSLINSTVKNPGGLVFPIVPWRFSSYIFFSSSSFLLLFCLRLLGAATYENDSPRLLPPHQQVQLCHDRYFFCFVSVFCSRPWNEKIKTRNKEKKKRTSFLLCCLFSFPFQQLRSCFF